jgi:hypothetical protein
VEPLHVNQKQTEAYINSFIDASQTIFLPWNHKKKLTDKTNMTLLEVPGISKETHGEREKKTQENILKRIYWPLTTVYDLEPLAA